MNEVAARDVWFPSDQSAAYKNVSADAFEYSCDAPRLMLDVNVALARSPR